MLHLLVWSLCSRIMSPNTTKLWHNYQRDQRRPRSPDCPGLSSRATPLVYAYCLHWFQLWYPEMSVATAQLLLVAGSYLPLLWFWSNKCVTSVITSEALTIFKYRNSLNYFKIHVTCGLLSPIHRILTPCVFLCNKLLTYSNNRHNFSIEIL